MNDTFYLLDNNALTKLSSDQRASTFFLEQCRVPDEVLYEAGPARAAGFEAIRYPTTPTVLRAVQKVMETVPAGDTKFVDLYRNKGNADPFLVACALVEEELAATMLVRPHWVVVTDDNAVRRKTDEFDISWLASKAFGTLLEAERGGGQHNER